MCVCVCLCVGRFVCECVSEGVDNMCERKIDRNDGYYENETD